MRRIQLDEPDNVRKHNPRVDRDLDAIVMKCLEKKPDRRYATARELAEDLRRWYRGEPVLARRVTKLERSARWFLRRPALLSACAFGILAVVLGTGGGLAAWGYVLSQRDVKKATDAENDAKRARDALSVSNDQLVAQTEQLTAARDELTANNLQLTDATKKATEAAAQAVAAERVASQAANALDRVVYANKILLARTYWEMGNAIRAREEMQRCKPQYRGWEWRKLLMEVNAPLLGTAESDLGENLIVASDERGSRAAVVDENGKIHLLACETPAMEIDEQHPAIREVAVLEGSEHLVRALALSGDGRRLGAIFPKSLRVWDAENGRLLGDGPLPGEVVAKLTFSDAGNLLAVEQGDHALQVWQIPSSGAPVRLATCTGHGDVVNALQFTPDERGLISAGNDAQLFLWDARTGRKVLKFGTGAPDDTRKAGEAVLSGISQMTVSFDGAWVATCEYAGDVTIWNAKDGRRCARLIHKLSAEQSEASHLPIAALVFSPDATQLAAVEGAVVTVWDLPPALATANPSQAPPEFTPSSIVGEGSETLFAARFCPDGQVLVTTGVDESVDLWKVASGEKIQSLSGHRAAGRHIAIRPDGAEVVSVDLNGAVFRWDLATGATVKKDMVLLKGHFDKIHQLEYSRDSQHLVTASSDGTARIWDAESGEQQHSFSVPDDDEANPSFAPIERVALNADFTQLALGTNDGRVQLWDPLNGALVQELQGVQAKSGDFGRLGLAQTIDFSPEAMRLAIASLDGSIQLWSMQAGSAPIVVHEHAGEINCLRFSRDGQLLISGGADGKVCAWDATQGAMVKLLNDGGPHAVHSVAFSPDGTLAAFGLSDRTVHLCDLRSGENLTLPDRFGVTQSNDDLGVLTLTFSQRGNLLAAAGDDNTVVIWDVPSGEFVTQLAGHTGQVRQIVFSPNDSKVATASADNTGRIWDLRTTAEPGRSSGRRTIVLRDTKNPPQFGHTGRINMVAFSADGKWLATCSDDRTTQAWNAESGSHLRTFSDHTDSIRAIAISPDGNRLVSACDDGRVRIWDTSRVMEEVAPAAPDEPVQSIGGSITNTAWTSLNGPFATYQGHSGGVGFVRFTRDGGQVLSAVTGNAPVAQLWNTSDFAKHGEFRGQVIEGSNSARCLKLSRHGDWLAANGPVATSIGVWSVHDRQQKWMLHTHPRAVTTFEFSPDGAFLASGCLDGVLRIWSMETGGLETELAGHASQAAQSKVDGGIRHLAFSQDGQTIATAGGDGAVRLWNVPTRKELRTLIGHTDAVLHVEFNPQNENMLASSSRDETAILWDLTQGKAERVIDGHEGGVVGSTFDPVTGSRLVTASEDGTMLVSDAENAQTLSKFTQLKKDDRIAPLIAFRPDGKQLAVTTDEYVVQLLQTEETPAQHAERVNQWRMTSVDAAQTAKNWQGMLFHLGYLLPAVDDVALLHYQHGIALAELERWQESRRAFERTLELVSGFPDSQCTVYMRLGLVQLKCNDEPAFKNTLRALVETAEQQRVNGNTNFSNDINAGWLAALRSGAAVNFDKLISRVQEAVASDENSVYWRETLGLLLYRARQYDRAVVELERAVEQSNGTDLEAQFILSLALHRLGRGKEGLARYTDALRKMGAWQDDVPPDARQPDVVPTSWEYREQRLWFQAEAETVFREEIAPDVPQS
ncbi:MAG: PQQ-binding-like beta-propeller repeat protein [Planctomycetaceae bacterium]|nr:PQQ-binding-like beta-propeller repeat protein [Planctomycetaceae bacterium]